ncbi:MAG: beta-galactosidase [Christensenellaceae bacterium]|nr:beta-galactosidase [Christensenellaceae bacterium]
MQLVIEGNEFKLNGETFKIYSGAIHYFRILPEYWEDRLMKLKAAGFNTVETYVAWNIHEPKQGEYKFDGICDLVKFVKTAEKLGLYVVLRPGPYICAEWDFGGLPAWLLADDNMRVRCYYEPYIKAVENYFSKLLPLVVPLQSTHGGNIIAMQVENEYGSYSNDKKYLQFLEKLMLRLGVDVLLLTSDGPESDMLSGGTVPHIFKTANFGSFASVQMKKLRKFQKDGPLMCTEYWLGWFDHWGDRRHHKRTHKTMINDLKWFLKNDCSFNLYMFHGGTNFGFNAGANFGKQYDPDVTSYDYDAPLNEYGGYTKKYHAVRDTMFNSQGVAAPELPPAPVLQNIGIVELAQKVSLFECLSELGKEFDSPTAEYMEKFGQTHGLILYKHKIIGEYPHAVINVDDVHDHAYVYINEDYKGHTDRNKNKPVSVGTLKSDDVVGVLVEGLGRQCYGATLCDRKGTSRIRVNNQILSQLRVVTLQLDDISSVDYTRPDTTFPKFFKGQFKATSKNDCFVEFSDLRKGYIWVNGFNIGRYRNEGPQKSLYLPGVLLQENNEIVVLELESITSARVAITDRHRI